MEKHEVVPDVIDTVPKSVLKVEFGNAAVNLGNFLTIQQVKHRPTLVSWTFEPKKLYTLCFTDPDAPTRANPAVREWHHWLVVNIPGNQIEKGDTLTEFVPSCPGNDSGIHRYTFVVYEQPSTEPLSCDEARLNTSVDHRNLRRHFSIRNFSKKYGLGEPIAGNFFTTQWDEYVPVLRRELGLD